MTARFLRVTVDSWTEVTRLIQRWTHAGSRDWAFRGQKIAAWNVSSSLERALDDYECDDHLTLREAWMMAQFLRRIHLHERDRPRNRVEALALMQHHGAPTRLVDFTYSFYVASVFALDGVRHDAAVFALNLSKLRRQLFRSDDTHQTATIFRYLMHCTNELEGLLARSAEGAGTAAYDRAILCVEPARLSTRMSIQRGLFAVATDLQVSFESNLLSFFDLPASSSLEGLYEPAHLLDDSSGVCFQSTDSGGQTIPDDNVVAVKFVIPAGEIQRAAIKELMEMNLDESTIYPGLDGFAQSLKRPLVGLWSSWGDEDSRYLGDNLSDLMS